MSLNPRKAAVETLLDIEKNGEYSVKAINEALRNLEPRDKAFANEIILGVMRNKLRLDFIIQSYSKVKLAKMTPYVLQVLRCGVYQILYMDKIPVSAACNEAVKLTAARAKSAKGFVNGVLRNIARNVNNIPKPRGKITEIMSVEYSCPLWLTELLCRDFGEGMCEKILADSLVPHMTMIRANSMKTTARELSDMLKEENISADVTEGMPNCLTINGAININASKLYKDGYYSLQNINSQKAVQVLEPKSGETVIDVCAAPGGKTTYAAELMKNEGKVIAFDVYEHKIKLIENAAQRLGLHCIEAVCHNSENVVDKYIGVADRVLADVPCSGIGVIHRKPDIKYNRRAEDIDTLCEMQKNILNSAAEYVRPGGVLVYSTCTILTRENSDRVEEFLSEHTNFEKEFEKLYLAHETGGSGFYICKMRKKNS